MPKEISEAARMLLKVGRKYSRKQISAALGGSIRSYLPVSRGNVVAGCFKLTPRLNPLAPREVLFGSGPMVRESAQRAAAQREPIPVFIYRKPKQWEYVGDFVCTGINTDPAVVAAKQKANPLRPRIAGVLTFKEVDAKISRS